MKKGFTFIFACLLSVIAFGQFEWVYKNGSYNEFTKKFVKTTENNYVLYSYEEYGGEHHFTNLDDAGNVLFDFNLPYNLAQYNTIDAITDIISLPDGTISFAGGIIDIDPISMWGLYSYAIFNVNSSGEITRVISIGNQEINQLAVLSDGSYIILDGVFFNFISRVYLENTFFWQVNLNQYETRDLAVTPTDSILISTMQGLLVLNEDGVVVTLFPNFIFSKIKVDTQGSVLGARDDSLFLLSPDFELLASTGFPGDTILDFAMEGDQIVVLTGGGHIIYRFDNSLNPINSFALDEDGQLDFIAIGPERLVLAGTERYGDSLTNQNIRSPFVKDYAFDGDGYGLGRDVGVVNIVQGNETQLVSQTPSDTRVRFKNVKVTVRNFGDEPVDSLYLRAPGNQFFNTYAFYNNLSLQPGEEKELIWPSLFTTFPTDTTLETIDLCIWTSHPDIRLDEEADNDRFCAGFLVDAEEVSIDEPGIRLFPNPASGVLNVLWPAEGRVAGFRVFDAAGRRMGEWKPAPGETGFVLSVSGWPAGVYFLQYWNEGMEMGVLRFAVGK
jgi:hypothetical protein